MIQKVIHLVSGTAGEPIGEGHTLGSDASPDKADQETLRQLRILLGARSNSEVIHKLKYLEQRVKEHEVIADPLIELLRDYDLIAANRVILKEDMVADASQHLAALYDLLENVKSAFEHGRFGLYRRLKKAYRLFVQAEVRRRWVRLVPPGLR